TIGACSPKNALDYCKGLRLGEDSSKAISSTILAGYTCGSVADQSIIGPTDVLLACYESENLVPAFGGTVPLPSGVDCTAYPSVSIEQAYWGGPDNDFCCIYVQTGKVVGAYWYFN